MGKTVKRDKKEMIRFLKFIGFSVSAGVIQFLSFTLLDSVFKLPYSLAYLTALVLSVLWNFTFNRKFTFKSASNVPIAMIKVACYYIVFTPLSTFGGDALTKSGVNEYVVLIGTMLINFITEFLFDRFFVFKNSLDTAKTAAKEENIAKVK